MDFALATLVVFRNNLSTANFVPIAGAVQIVHIKLQWLRPLLFEIHFCCNHSFPLAFANPVCSAFFYISYFPGKFSVAVVFRCHSSQFSATEPNCAPLRKVSCREHTKLRPRPVTLLNVYRVNPLHICCRQLRYPLPLVNQHALQVPFQLLSCTTQTLHTTRQQRPPACSCSWFCSSLYASAWGLVCLNDSHSLDKADVMANESTQCSHAPPKVSTQTCNTLNNHHSTEKAGMVVNEST
jgi:hypothetical protein